MTQESSNVLLRRRNLLLHFTRVPSPSFIFYYSSFIGLIIDDPLFMDDVVEIRPQTAKFITAT